MVQLQFQSATVTQMDGAKTAHAAQEISVVVQGKEKTVTFDFGSDDEGASVVNLAACATFSLEVAYTGHLNNQMAGFYRSQYTDKNGNLQFMASTQFESLDARRAFPCIDEPAAKATFVVSLTVDAHLLALSNMPVQQRSTVNPEKTKYTFLETPKMSTYLLAFIVAEMDCVSGYTEGGVQVSVYTPPGQAHMGTFALDTALHNLQTYNKFFATSYPLPKLDMVAIPEFAAGAMENWGLVTYRQVDLLIDPVTASKQQQQRVAVVVAHELAHQWFGNLVTMAWWDDLWLNEGFASWCENYATDLLHPSYQMWDQFTVDHLLRALQLDALQTSHPIQVPILHATEVEQVFDAISYCKGASVVRMCAAVLGMDAFQAGLQAYMKQYAYQNTETFDLWQAWQTSSNLPVPELMASWTEQMGFPYLTVTAEEWKDDSVTLTLQQAWFLSDGSTGGDEAKDKLWTIPIFTCTSAGTQDDMVLMREKTATITVSLKQGADDWIKLNAGQQVPMRVLLTDTMLQRLKPAIRSKTLSAMDRASLVTDSYALVKAGHMAPASLLDLLTTFQDEDSYVVWSCLSSVLKGLDAILSEHESVSAQYQTFCQALVLGLLKKVGWESKAEDDHLSTLLRSILIQLLSSFCATDTAVQDEAKRRLALFWKDPTDMQALPSDYRASVFGICLQHGDAALYQQIKGYYKTATNNAEAKHVLNSLGFIGDAALKTATMEWSTSGEIKLQDFFYVMGSVSRSNKLGRDTAWQYLQDNFDKIQQMLATASPSLMNAVIVMCAGGGFCTEDKAKEIEAFFEKHPLPSSSRKIAQTVEGIRANAKFYQTLTDSPLVADADNFWKALMEKLQA